MGGGGRDDVDQTQGPSEVRGRESSDGHGFRVERWDRLFRNRTFLLTDLLGWMVIPLTALTIRLGDLEKVRPYAVHAALYTASAVGTALAALWITGTYRRMWRYAGLDELFSLTTALTVSGMAAVLLDTVLQLPILPRGPTLPRSTPIIATLLTITWSGGIRFTLQYAYHIACRGKRGSDRTIILGAGDAGSSLAKEIRATPALDLEPVGFIDDDRSKEGMIIGGLPVLGDRETIAEVARTHRVTSAIFAMPAAPGFVIRDLRDRCLKAQLRVLTVPGLHALLTGKVTVSHLRQVQIEDLLRREPVQTDRTTVGTHVAGKTVLVTGAGGSIGSELCRQLAQLEVGHLILLGHGENSIFAIENELRSLYPTLPLTAVIADVRDEHQIDSVFTEFRPIAVFHAAAHKHVPLMESNPQEAVNNNVGGTLALLNVAVRHGTHHFILVSTDKAVNPTNVMGATKRVAEHLVAAAAARSGRHFLSVRFGNVLGSRGSVVPTFQEQIAAGGPVCVTHPDVTRYFMTIPEAVQLVLQAMTMGRGGETFVLDMGQPVRIVDLARDLIELSGLKVEEDIPIRFIGLRPGEKMFEELFLESEEHGRTEHEKIFIAHAPASPTLTEFDARALLEVARLGDGERTKALLSSLVGESLHHEALPDVLPTSFQGQLVLSDRKAAT